MSHGPPHRHLDPHHARRRRAAIVVAMAVPLLLGVCLSIVGCDGGGETVSHAIDLQDRLADLDLHEEAGEWYIVIEHDGRTQRLTAGEYLAALEQSRQRQRDRGPLFVLFNITSWTGVLWVAMGLTGQLLFTGRMVVQWLASEKEHRSVVPPVFWWLSLIGASMLLTYFLWRKDIVGVLGQGSGWAIYARNLWMIHRPGFASPAPAASIAEEST